MSESNLIYQLVKNDPRYTVEAYDFVREGLVYATEILHFGNQSQKSAASQGEEGGRELDLGSLEDLGGTAIEKDEPPSESIDEMLQQTIEKVGDAGQFDLDSDEGPVESENHLTGQELCLALRQFAIDQYGLMAKSVLNSWGICSTSDFGSIVYNIIDIGWMKKSVNDRREHFDQVYEFQAAFVEQFKIQR